VKVVDTSGAPINGAQVSFQVTSGTATVQSPTATTDTTGQASTRVNAGGTAGNIVITATFSSFTVTFNLTSRLPGPQNLVLINGASLLPNSPVSPGSVAILTGTGILPGVTGLYTSYSIVGPLSTTFPVPAGTGSITFNNAPAPIYWVSNVNGVEQVALQIPFEITPGQVSMTVNAVGGGTSTVNVSIQQYSPAIFETVYNGRKFAVATRPDGSYISPSNPARRGEAIRFYATGLGQVTPPAATNTAGIPGQSVLATIVVGLNNGGIQLTAAEYAPGLVGVYVITTTVPIDTTTGPAQPLGLIVNDSAGNPIYAQGSVIPIQ